MKVQVDNSFNYFFFRKDPIVLYSTGFISSTIPGDYTWYTWIITSCDFSDLSEVIKKRYCQGGPLDVFVQGGPVPVINGVL